MAFSDSGSSALRPWALTLLRVAAAYMFLLHGWGKFVFTGIGLGLMFQAVAIAVALAAGIVFGEWITRNLRRSAAADQ